MQEVQNFVHFVLKESTRIIIITSSSVGTNFNNSVRMSDDSKLVLHLSTASLIILPSILTALNIISKIINFHYCNSVIVSHPKMIFFLNSILLVLLLLTSLLWQQKDFRNFYILPLALYVFDYHLFYPILSLLSQ